MSRLDLAIEQLIKARQYTVRLLDAVNPADWFRPSPNGVTHIAWQVGHLAAAEYFLTLERIRGVQASDEHLISQTFRQQFGRQSTPDPDPTKNPSATDLRAILDRVHRQALQELKTLPDEVLDAPVGRPHPMFQTKLGAILWCSAHEMVHTGQIGLLRRLFGQAPLW
jgi:uncharacterized damage-inducible protein DinB